MNKYYLRSIREDGFGECVVPEMEEPIFKRDAAIATQQNLEWHSYLSSLPVSALAHPDLAKKIGWVENVEEQYQLFDKEDICCWHIVSKEWYKENKQNDLQRIVLVKKKQEEKSEVAEAVQFADWLMDNNYGCKINPDGGYLWYEDDDHDAVHKTYELYSAFLKLKNK